MLIDLVIITVTAGAGGDGAVAFSKVMMSLGPTGGTGGKGGDVYIEAVSDIGALRKYRTVKTFAAENGADGRSKFRDGRRGADLILPVPRGTVIHNHATGETREMVAAGERALVARGGWGGKGNFLFRSSQNTSPHTADKGLIGEEFVLKLELKLIADVGLIGLPNVGKSSFLNAVTNAKSPVANYPFTTLEPHLGAYYGLIIADIPGLIEGASRGKGLGIHFLRHIERTRVLFHLISAESRDPATDYQVIRAELKEYNKALLEKPEYLCISKSDTADTERLKEITVALTPYSKKILPISIVDDTLMASIQKLLNTLAP